jgi:formamidopyrimidine-DNA glycosylase
VFEKHGEPCPEGCGGEVVREKVGGRPTHFCPECQRLSGGEQEQRLTFA